MSALELLLQILCDCKLEILKIRNDISDMLSILSPLLNSTKSFSFDFSRQKKSNKTGIRKNYGTCTRAIYRKRTLHNPNHEVLKVSADQKR